MMHGGYGYGYGNGMGFGMLIWWIIIIIGIALAVYGLISLFRGQSGKKGFVNDNRPLEILKERFANGELSEEEYEQKKQILLK
ncbi:MAG: SHOCT domain-containing protein [Bacillota bacterium]